MTPERKAVWGWALYDWANSAFATTIMAGFFPIFFKEFWSVGANVNLSTARLGVGNAVAGLLMAVAAPILGAIADQAGARKRFLIFFAYMGALMSGALFFVRQGAWEWAILVYVLGVIGFSGANVFYDAMLPAVAAPEKRDRVSSLGYALGYLGGGLLFLLNVLMTVMPSRFGLPDAAVAVRLSFLSVALWWGGFTLFTLFWAPEDPPRSNQKGIFTLTRDGLSQAFATIRNLPKEPTIAFFLLAYWCYIDGVDTIVRMAVDYGLSIGFDKTDLIISLLLVQFVGFPAAIAFGVLGEKWGARKAIFLGLAAYLFITCWGIRMDSKSEFYMLAVMIALVQGGLQALSRSYFSRIIPEQESAQYFGIYNLMGKFATILGPLLMAGTGLLARAMLMPAAPTPEQVESVSRLASRFSLGSISILFLLGGIFFYAAKEKRTGGTSKPPEA